MGSIFFSELTRITNGKDLCGPYQSSDDRLSHISKQGSDFQTIIAFGNLLSALAEGRLNQSGKNRTKEVAEKVLELSPDKFISIMADVYELKSVADQFLRSL